MKSPFIIALTLAALSAAPRIASSAASSASSAASASASASDWKGHSLGSDLDLNGVVWTGGQLVAVGGAFSGENVVYTSPDGDTWTRRTVEGTTQDGLSAVCWTGSQLVAVGPEGNVLTSPDGIKWTQRPNAFAEPWVGIAWTGTLLVAVTGVGRVLTSADGIAWETRFGGDTAQADFNSVAWNGSQAIAVAGSGYRAADGEAYSSPDGIHWTRHAAPGAPGLHAAAWTGNRWAAVGGIFDVNVDKAESRLGATSADGLAWTANPDSAGEVLEGLVWTGNRLVAVGWDGTRMASTDGSHWTRMNTDTLPRLQSVAWTGKRLVAVGWSSTVVTLDEEPVGIRPHPRRAMRPAGQAFPWTDAYDAAGRRSGIGRNDGAAGSRYRKP